MSDNVPQSRERASRDVTMREEPDPRAQGQANGTIPKRNSRQFRTIDQVEGNLHPAPPTTTARRETSVEYERRTGNSARDVIHRDADRAKRTRAPSPETNPAPKRTTNAPAAKPREVTDLRDNDLPSTHKPTLPWNMPSSLETPRDDLPQPKKPDDRLMDKSNPEETESSLEQMCDNLNRLTIKHCETHDGVRSNMEKTEAALEKLCIEVRKQRNKTNNHLITQNTVNDIIITNQESMAIILEDIQEKMKKLQDLNNGLSPSTIDHNIDLSILQETLFTVELTYSPLTGTISGATTRTNRGPMSLATHHLKVQPSGPIETRGRRPLQRTDRSCSDLLLDETFQIQFCYSPITGQASNTFANIKPRNSLFGSYPKN